MVGVGGGKLNWKEKDNNDHRGLVTELERDNNDHRGRVTELERER